MIESDLRKEIEIATSWNEEELHPLKCDAFQLIGLSFSDEEVTLNFQQLSKAPEFGEQMLFRIQGELFYCDEVRWVVYDYRLNAHSKLFDYSLSCRVVSRC